MVPLPSKTCPRVVPGYKKADKFLNKKMWYPRLPDLNPVDFYLWGYLKTVVYNPMPNTLEDFMPNIKRAINEILESDLKCFRNFEKWWHLVVTTEGGQIK